MMLNYNIKGTELNVTPELRSYVERALAHAEKFLGSDPTAHVDVELEFSQVRDGGKYRAEFTVSAEGQLYRAQEWGSAMHEAIDLCIAELVKELRRDKDKKQHFLRRGALKMKEYIRGFRNKM